LEAERQEPAHHGGREYRLQGPGTLEDQVKAEAKVEVRTKAKVKKDNREVVASSALALALPSTCSLP
jgi:hypothetical protein